MQKENIQKENIRETELFVTCGQGLEQLLTEELEQLGLQGITPSYRGVYVRDSSMGAIFLINYCSRIAGRVLLPLTLFRCHDRDSLYKAALKINWLNYIPKGSTFAIDANVTHRNLKNSLFAAQVMKDAICDQFREKTGGRPSIDTSAPDVQLNLFIQADKGIISFDTSGAPLYKRGYRLETVDAPLQESLAAAMLQIARYTGEETFCDPCCGSGTLLIEAALVASNTPPGYLRKRWGFTQLPDFSNQAWLTFKNERDQQRKPLAEGKIFGADISKNSVRATKANLRGAGFLTQVEVVASDFRDYTPPEPPQLIFANPPHGLRLDDVDSLRSSYRAFGQFLKEKCARPGRAFVFVGQFELTKELGLAPKKRHVINNSGVDSRLLEFDIY
jgi:putative N6-adenine-specific DNA methylase